MKLESISLRRSDLNERWVQDQIAEDPSILGLGDLVMKDKERSQPNAGRLDLLLQDPESLKRYEVEVQLGATDESHIVRTIEYWDIEKKRYPQYEHAAVIVAEEITGRFLNVIQLFNGAIPLIAIKMTAYKVGEQYALTFVKVLDELTYGFVDEDEPITEPTDRNYWESHRGTKATLAATDSLLLLVKEVEPKALLKYNKHYIGLEVDGSPLNFVTFMPRKVHVIMSIKVPNGTSPSHQQTPDGLEGLDRTERRRPIHFVVAAVEVRRGRLRHRGAALPVGLSDHQGGRAGRGRHGPLPPGLSEPGGAPEPEREPPRRPGAERLGAALERRAVPGAARTSSWPWWRAASWNASSGSGGQQSGNARGRLA